MKNTDKPATQKHISKLQIFIFRYKHKAMGWQSCWDFAASLTVEVHSSLLVEYCIERKQQGAQQNIFIHLGLMAEFLEKV